MSFDIKCKVPFFIYNEKLFEPAVDNTAHGTVDIFPTMVNLFGLDPVPTLGFDMLGDEADLYTHHEPMISSSMTLL